jgi:hypothetical protein
MDSITVIHHYNYAASSVVSTVIVLSLSFSALETGCVSIVVIGSVVVMVSVTVSCVRSLLSSLIAVKTVSGTAGGFYSIEN